MNSRIQSIFIFIFLTLSIAGYPQSSPNFDETLGWLGRKITKYYVEGGLFPYDESVTRINKVEFNQFNLIIYKQIYFTIGSDRDWRPEKKIIIPWKEIEKIELRSKSLSISWVKHNSPIDIPFNFDNEQDIRVRMQTAVDALLRFNRGANNEAY